MDRLTKEQRSKNMSAVRGKGNKTTELVFLKLLKKNRITGWRRHHNIEGTPDFVFPKQMIAIFIDGCFWHGCKKHGSIPKTHYKFWTRKIKRNKQRDKEINSYYKKMHWQIIRIWEHELQKNPEKILNRIISFLK